MSPSASPASSGPGTSARLAAAPPLARPLLLRPPLGLLCARRWASLSSPPPPSEPPGREGEGSSSPALSSAASTPTFPFSPPAQGWKKLYIQRHQEMAGRVSEVIKFVKQCSRNDSLEVGDYLKAVAALHSLDLGFVDIKLFLLTVKHNVLLNLIGLHYTIFYLRMPEIVVTEALQSSQISERQVSVNWFKLGRWFYGFRLPDESRSRRVSLWNLRHQRKKSVRYSTEEPFMRYCEFRLAQSFRAALRAFQTSCYEEWV